MTHDELVDIAERWLKKNGSCGVVLRELAANSEIADVLGFGSDGHSVLIECKASRADFLADKKKPFRRYPEEGMGRYQLYCCPEGLIEPSELPEKWGLLYVKGGKARALVNPMRMPYLERFDRWEFRKRSKTSERAVMYSILRRLSLSGCIEHELYKKARERSNQDHHNRILNIKTEPKK